MNSCNRQVLYFPRVKQSLSTFLAAAFAFLFATTSAHAQTFNQLYDFQGKADGGNPVAGLTVDSEGNLYGTTEAGGRGTCKGNFLSGCGVVFKLSTTGELTAIYQFQGGTDGADPRGGVIRDARGNLYGTTFAGGGATCAFAPAGGCGTIFKIDANGNETVLYRFSGGPDGAGPSASLYQDAQGTLWGTAELGGIVTNPQCSGAGCGTIFRLGRTGKFFSRAFQGPPNDGASPAAALVADPHGNLYGTTLEGGPNFVGILFKISPTEKLTIVHEFDITNGDAGFPTGLLVSGGKLYGVGSAGGANQGGAVYDLDLSGERVLYNFPEGNDQSILFASGTLARETDGSLYGTVSFGFQDENFGELYKLDAAGNFTVSHEFLGNPDGASPQAGVIRDAAGNIYGTTQKGGAFDAGTIFKLIP